MCVCFRVCACVRARIFTRIYAPAQSAGGTGGGPLFRCLGDDGCDAVGGGARVSQPCVCVCVCACARARAIVFVRVCARAIVVCVCVARLDSPPPRTEPHRHHPHPTATTLAPPTTTTPAPPHPTSTLSGARLLGPPVIFMPARTSRLPIDPWTAATQSAVGLGIFITGPPALHACRSILHPSAIYRRSISRPLALCARRPISVRR